MPLIATRGAASAQGFGEFAQSAAVNYIEDVFSTFLYTGQGSTNSYVNGIDLAGKGGLVWIKARSGTYGTAFNGLWDTARGTGKFLSSNTTGAQSGNSGDLLSAFNSDGFTVNVTYLGGFNETTNASATNYCSWTFRKQPKFFDVVTYTGNGTSGRTVAHNLGSVPGCIIVKRTSGDPIEWAVYHRSLDATSPQNYYLRLNTTAARALQSGNWNDTAPTSTVFTLGDSGAVNTNGETYVAYVFAHDAGGFGLTGTDNVISCGSYTGNGSATGPTVTLGYEPQWVLVKRTDSTSSWTLSDNMRGQPVDGATAILSPNLSDAEASATTAVSPTATGFQVKTSGATYNASGGTYIYIAIRRGPMRVPTVGTTVFAPDASTGTGSTRTITTNFPVDFQLANSRAGSSGPVRDRLRGGGVGTTKQLLTTTTAAETTVSSSFGISFDNNTGIGLYQTTSNASSTNYIYYHFRRAPSFFDEVCYTGDGTDPRNITHNLTVSPELVIIKARSRVDDWVVRSSAFPTHGVNGIAYLNLTDAATNGGYSYVPTTTTFQIGGNFNQNQSGQTYVAYLFATCAGVSKVGSYTGNGSTQTIDCGFTGGARFVLIRRTDSTGDWYVYDTARGMTVLTDPYLLLNSTAAETATLGSVTTVSTGFAVNASILAAINTNAASYIFLAIA